MPELLRKTSFFVFYIYIAAVLPGATVASPYFHARAEESSDILVNEETFKKKWMFLRLRPL